MHNNSITSWQHGHVFGQDQVRSGERRTLIVIILTGVMMVGEIIAGVAFGSMALLADGIHMGTHMLGLTITFIAYIYARKYANDQRYNFGTGKVNALAGYSSAIFLVIIAAYMGYESIQRFINPVEIQYNLAILVAVIGLVVNGVSMWILGTKGHTHAPGLEHDHGHEHAHDHSGQADEEHDHGEHARGEETDHNLKAAYLHVLTDAFTSLLAIVALLGAKYFNFNWMDPFMGVVGAILVTRWSILLISATVKILLDHQTSKETRSKIIRIIESYRDTKVSDFHMWSIGPGIYSAAISVVTKYPDIPNKYKTMIPSNSGVVHATVEVHPCQD
jgi:cation diffusion facilitator family transporter